MAYLDLDTATETPEQEEERRRQLLGMLVGRSGAPVLQPRADQPPPALAASQPTIPSPRMSTAEAPTIGSPAFNPPSFSPVRPARPDVMPTREDFPAKPELGGWKKVLGLGAGFALGSAPLVRNILHGQEDAANRQYQGATQDWERGQADKYRAAQTEEAQARAASLRNPKPEKPEGLQQTYADAVQDAISRGVDPAKDPKVQQIGDAITALQKQPAPPKENKAVGGTLNGKPAWGLQTDQGWIDPQTRQSIPGFQPAPSFAETGLYEPVEVPQAGGGMAPGVFNKRTGTTTPMAPSKTPIPKEAQKAVDESLTVARGMDRLEGSQRQILAGAEKRGQQGPLGGGPYLNGPESMQFVANHIAMTFGSVKGARIGRDIIEQHVKARDLDQSTEAMAQRVLSGGVITYTQAQQMMDTAKINRAQAWKQAQDAASQYGVPNAVKPPSDIGSENKPIELERGPDGKLRPKQ